MKSTSSSSGQKTRAIALPFLAIILTFSWPGLSGAIEAPVAKVTQQQAEEIALKKVPGDVTSVVIEKKNGKNVYVVEIIAKEDGAETDVFVDIESGEVVGTDK